MHSESYCQDLINSITDPIMIIDRECRINMVNDAFLSMQDDTRENVIGQPCFKMLHHQDMHCRLPDGECPYRDVFETGKPVKVTHRHFTRRHREIIVELAASPVRDRDGSVVRMIEVMRDVTAERRLEEEKRQSLDLLESVLEGIGEGVVVVDREYRILTANKGYLSQVGKSKDDVPGMHCYEASHHFDSHCMDNGHECPVKTVFETGLPAQALHIHYDRQNEEIYVECRAYPIKDSAGNVIHAIETLNDVSERVRLEQKLKDSEEKYRDLYDNAPDGYYSLAGNGMIVEANRTFLNMLGYSRDEVIGKLYFNDLLSDESAQTCHTKFPEFKKSGQIGNLELNMLKRDGALLPVTMHATAVYDGRGNFVMSRSVIRDITERKEIDDKNRRLQAQLFQSQKLEALGTLAGGIAHDFNNLLASILGYASLAKTDLHPDNPAYQHVDIIETASIRASELTQQLLAFARGGKYDAKPTDVNTIVREVVALLSRIIEKNITIVLATDSNLRHAICDAGQIQQAILNICINGRDAMPRGGRLTVTTADVHLEAKDVQFFVDAQPGDYVRISVSDTGIGMDRETRERLFEPFFTTKEKGTGLGLALAYGILKKHSGFIQVHSEPGKGSTFEVNLLACMNDETCVKKQDFVSLRRGTETILVVDDEPMVRDLARDVLKRYGYTVLTAGGGEEAIERFRQRSDEIDAVILDMVMPAIEGREVFRRIQEMKPGVKVLVSSGYSHDRDAEELIEQGARRFLQKPFRIAELVRVVGEVMEEKQEGHGAIAEDPGRSKRV
ncbi:MAG TPA: PAS domain-containing protein [Nitrospirota bacterium]|nr:PAS domain-containing protein [Nitrospirota bacterium]